MGRKDGEDARWLIYYKELFFMILLIAFIAVMLLFTRRLDGQPNSPDETQN